MAHRTVIVGRAHSNETTMHFLLLLKTEEAEGPMEKVFYRLYEREFHTREFQRRLQDLFQIKRKITAWQRLEISKVHRTTSPTVCKKSIEN